MWSCLLWLVVRAVPDDGARTLLGCQAFRDGKTGLLLTM